MKTTINLIALFSIITLVISCTKQPSADFTTDKTKYVAGEVIRLTNTSQDASKYQWTMPDGQTTTSFNVEYTPNINLSSQTLIFKLKALSRNGEKISYAQRSVSLVAATGQLTLWTNTNYQISIDIDGVPSGTITSYYNSQPPCGSSGCVIKELSVGNHLVTGTNGITNWNFNVTISKDQCSIYQLY
jgi:hypothetical protein